MRILYAILSILIFLGNTPILNTNIAGTYANTTKNFVAYTGEIKNIFLHSLIAYPEILEKKSVTTILSYDKDCIDYIEFENMLVELYKNNYVLIDINDTFAVDKNGFAVKKTVYVPKGKKPVVIGVDDVVYDPKKSGNGMVDKLCLDDDDNFYTETYINGKIEKSYNREFVPILEQFLQKFPDFSPKNARFCINLTGFCGIFGYRTTDVDKNFAESEVKKVRPIVKKLKDLGYTFACHSYNHFHMKKISLQDLKTDLLLWKNNIETIIGKTSIYVYPYGEWEIANGCELSKKQKLLLDYGFKLFLGVGIYDFFTYMPLNKNMEEKILFADRKNIDGYSLYYRKAELSSLFDTERILSEYSKKRHELR